MKKPELLILGLDGATAAFIKKEVAKGNLPGFTKMMERGVFLDDCMPVFPSITPTCWASIETGAVPSVTGALCQSIHVPGTSPEKYITPYSSINIHAERFWETAAKIGKKSLLINVPCSGPAKCENVLQVFGHNATTPDDAPERSYISGYPQQTFTNDGNGECIVDVVKVAGGGASKNLTAENDYLNLGNNTYLFRPVFSAPNFHPEELEEIEWAIIAEEDGIRLGTDIENAKQSPVILEKQWSQVITRNLKTDEGSIDFQFRARLDSYDKEKRIFSVCIMSANNFYKEITPRKLAEELSQIKQTRGLYQSALHSYAQNLPYDASQFIDSLYFSFDWSQKVIKHCMEKYEPDIIFDYLGHPDSFNHRFLRGYQKLKFEYEGDYEDSVYSMHKSYELADEYISWLLDNVVDENTTFALIADHGGVGNAEDFSQWSAMEKAGLLTYLDENSPRDWTNRNIDWSKTKAYPTSSCYIHVNLKGREPKGIVDPEDYDDTVREIIEALYKYCRSSDGKTIALAFAVEKTQAGFIGHGGENCGDVVYGLIGSEVGGYYGGVHAQQIPSARDKNFDISDIRCLCLFCGPKFKEGVTLTRPADLTDFAPTLCYAMGYPQPKDATGGVIFQAFKEE